METNKKPLLTHISFHCVECPPYCEDIVGTMHKCINCVTYALCLSCYAKTKHDPNHIFMVVKKPLDNRIIGDKKYSIHFEESLYAARSKDVEYDQRELKGRDKDENSSFRDYEAEEPQSYWPSFLSWY